MKKINLETHFKKILADTLTPVSIYLKIRDHFPNSILLESSDYHANDNSFSYICCNPIASFELKDNFINIELPDQNKRKFEITPDIDVVDQLHRFTKNFSVNSSSEFKFINNGIFGYTAYDAVRYFEDVTISKKPNSAEIPDIYYAVYKNIIAINHFKNEAFVFVIP